MPRGVLDAGLEQIRASPPDVGRLELIVARTAEAERAVLDAGTLDEHVGLVGDYWQAKAADPDPRTMLTLMNARAIALIAGEHQDRSPLAGDQLYVDLDLSGDNLPAGSRLAIGDAVIEVTEVPHTGCGKFIARFGIEAQKFVNSPAGRELNLRGINTRVIVGGIVRVGDTVEKRS